MYINALNSHNTIFFYLFDFIDVNILYCCCYCFLFLFNCTQLLQPTPFFAVFIQKKNVLFAIFLFLFILNTFCNCLQYSYFKVMYIYICTYTKAQIFQLHLYLYKRTTAFGITDSFEMQKRTNSTHSMNRPFALKTEWKLFRTFVHTNAHTYTHTHMHVCIHNSREKDRNTSVVAKIVNEERTCREREDHSVQRT